MKVSIKTGLQSMSWDDLVMFWRAADEIEQVAVCWVNDHLYDPGYPDATDRPATLEAMSALGALAVETSRARIGTLVAGNLFRHPALVANIATSLDHISGGRLELGLGAGWHRREHADHGIDLLTPSERLRAWAESTEIIHRLLTEDEVEFEGEYYRLDKARCEPKPIQQPRPPIVMGAAGPRALRIVARWADHWNVDGWMIEGGRPDRFREKLAILEQHCADIGRDIAEIEVSVQVWAADPGEVREHADELSDAGAHHIIVGFKEPDVGLLERTLEALL